ncbi:hypothetical protein QOT17_013295 [Balamuthia mandrillaris]
MVEKEKKSKSQDLELAATRPHSDGSEAADKQKEDVEELGEEEGEAGARRIRQPLDEEEEEEEEEADGEDWSPAEGEGEGEEVGGKSSASSFLSTGGAFAVLEKQAEDRKEEASKDKGSYNGKGRTSTMTTLRELLHGDAVTLLCFSPPLVLFLTPISCSLSQHSWKSEKSKQGRSQGIVARRAVSMGFGVDLASPPVSSCGGLRSLDGSPLFLSVPFFLGLAFIFLLVLDEDEVASVKVYWWMFWVVFLIGTFVLLQAIFALIKLLVKKTITVLFPESQIYYYTKEAFFYLAATAWAILQLATFRSASNILLEGIDDDGFFWINRILILILVIAIIRTILLLIVKYILAKYNQQHFWSSIRAYLFQEKVIYSLTSGKRKRRKYSSPENDDDDSSDYGELKRGKKKKTTKRGGGSYIGMSSGKIHLQGYQFGKAWKYISKNGDQRKELHWLERQTETTVSDEAVEEVADKLMRLLDYKRRGYFTLHEIQSYWGETEKAKRVLDMFDLTRTGTVTREDVVAAIRKVPIERKRLASTLRDREAIGRVLGRVVSSVFWVIMFIFALLLFGVDSDTLLVPFGTVFLGLSFIFGNSLKNIWEAIIVIFINKPFQVGDRINLGQPTDLIIEKVNLFTTWAYTPDNKLIILSNAALFNKDITQLKRSRNYVVSLNVIVHASTSSALITTFQQRLIDWCRTDEAPWDVDNLLFWVGVPDTLSRLTLSVWVELKGINWAVPSLYIHPRTRMWIAIEEICKELGIVYMEPDQRILLERVEQRIKARALPSAQDDESCSSTSSSASRDEDDEEEAGGNEKVRLLRQRRSQRGDERKEKGKEKQEPSTTVAEQQRMKRE